MLVNLPSVTQVVHDGQRFEPRQSGYGSQALNNDTYYLFNEITIHLMVNFSLWVKPFPRRNASYVTTLKNVRFLVMLEYSLS